MLNLSLARVLGSLVPVALALGCSSATPTPQAPEESATAGDAEAPASVEPEASSPAPGTDPAFPAEPEPPTGEPAPSAAATTPRDTRGKQEIQQVMANNRDKVRACYDAALAQNPGIKGDLVVDFSIDPRGDVKQAEVNWSQSDIHIPELDTCAANAVRSLKFPASSRGLESKVSFPFNFNPPKGDSPASPRPADSPDRDPPSRK